MNNEQPRIPVLPIDYAGPTVKRRRTFSVACVVIFVLGVAWLWWVIVPVSLNRGSGTFGRVRCASHLRQIGQAILLYGDTFKGQYPDTFGDLLLTEDIDAGAFICPDSNDTPATGPTTRAVVANLAASGHCSYIYLGKGLTNGTATADTVVAYEPIANHGGSGINVLFGNGVAEFITTPQAITTILNQVSARTWPVVMQHTLTSGPTTQRMHSR